MFRLERRTALAAALCLLLAVVHTWPLATSPGTLSRNDNADAELNEWILAWVAHQLPRSPAHLFDGNIFYPLPLTLTYSDSTILEGLLGTPFVLAGVDPLLVANGLTMAAFPLCGLAFFYQESGDFDNELATLKKMVAYARGHPAQLKWLKGEPLSKPADKFVPEKLHEYGLYYEKKENAEDDKRWYQISTLATDQYSNDPQGFKDAAGYWADLGEWKKAHESFEKARQLDPKSAATLVGLGQISAEMEDFASARKYYEEALKLEPNGQYAQTAKAALQKLKKK